MTPNEIASAQAMMQQSMNERARDEFMVGMNQQIVATFEYPLAAVTPEMRRIGAEVWKRCKDMEVFNEQASEAAYRAMHAAAPVEFCPEDRIAALTRERDEARAERDKWMDHTKFVMRDRIALRTRLAERDASLVKALRQRV